ncbi:MAG TPA: hypothetical protein VHD88_05465 [Pyrinomonadaceae bacterium]|nr:hypothetical protein [Pyrinomonadaceae bacterium]
MSANAAEVTARAGTSAPAVPKRITNAQTVCNERNEKGKACWGHLKQLRTAGEPAEVHLRGDDVLFKCHRCGTLYMGPPLGHVRDPEKQTRFVEAELTELLQAAGGTLPVIKKNDKGVYVLVEAGTEHAHTALAAKPSPTAGAASPPAVKTQPTTVTAQATSVAEKSMAAPAGPKPAAQPDRNLNRRSTYAGVLDSGPVPGETKEQKIERLAKVVAGAKQRAEEGGTTEHAPNTAAVTVVNSSADADAHRPATEAQASTGPATPADLAPDTVAPAVSSTPTTSQSGEADRTLMKRSTYAEVVDTGPIAGETHEQKIERLTKLAAAAKQRSEEQGAA